MEPSPIEYIVANGVVMAIFLLLVAFATIGVCATVSEIRYRIEKRRYRNTHL